MQRLSVGCQAVEAGAVLFDKDCTLLDSMAYWPELADRRIACLCGLVELEETLVPRLYQAMGVNLPSRSLVRRSPLVLGPRLDTIIAVATVLFLEGMEWDRARALVQAAFARADAEVEAGGGAKAFPAARSLLSGLRAAGVRVGVVTNDDHARSAKVLARVGLMDYVDAIVGGDEVRNPKPDPEMLNRMCDQLGIPPGECLLVGDAIADMEMGRAAGVKLTVGVATGSATREELLGAADAVVASLDEIRTREEEPPHDP